eukprot:4843997-Amphidinium_carterae.1
MEARSYASFMCIAPQLACGGCSLFFPSHSCTCTADINEPLSLTDHAALRKALQHSDFRRLSIDNLLVKAHITQL